MKSTKELARELGILRKRTRLDLQSHNPSKKVKTSLQVFDYLIVIDFESTCWQDAKQRSQEIIEFPAVLMNTESGEIENEFHHYVQPQECPLLSDFCKQLTGITQDSVDNGIPLDLCLRRFACWLAEMTKKKSIAYNVTSDTEQEKTCTFVTWSDWDLAVCLQYECRRKQFRKPRELNSWIDLRATYRKFYGRKPQGLNGALQEIGATFEGREHSGLHDARNTARLAWHMIKDGCVMQVTKTLPTTGSSCLVINGKLKTSSPITKTAVGSSNHETRRHLTVIFPTTVDRTHIENESKATNKLAKRLLNVENSSHDREMKVTLNQNSHEKFVEPDSIQRKHEIIETKSSGSLPADGEEDLPIKESVEKKTVDIRSNSMSSMNRNLVDAKSVKEIKCDEKPSSPADNLGQNPTKTVTLSHTIPVKFVLPNSEEAFTESGTSAVNCRSLAAQVESSAAQAEKNSKELDEEQRKPVASLNFESSTTIADLCGLNMDDWFDDDVDFGEVPIENHVTISKTSDCRVSPRHRCAYKTQFAIYADCGLSPTAGNETLTRVVDGFKEVTNVLSNIGLVRQSADFSIEPTSSVRNCSDKSTPVQSYKYSIGEHPSRVSNSSSFRAPRSVLGCIRTPAAVSSKAVHGQAIASLSCWKTPSNAGAGTPLAGAGTLMKKTSPLCDCGCRSKRKFVQRPGPNLGRTFFCCGSSSASKTVCKFFKWEQPTASPAGLSDSSENTPLTSSSVESSSYSTTLNLQVTPCSIRPRFPAGARILVPPARHLQNFSLL